MAFDSIEFKRIDHSLPSKLWEMARTENEISKIIVNMAYDIHTKLGPGLLESVYEEVMAHELNKMLIPFYRQKWIPISWKGEELGRGFRADLIVDRRVIVEIKSVTRIEPVFKKQILTYLKLTNLHLGLLINFNEELIKNGISRVVNNL